VKKQWFSLMAVALVTMAASPQVFPVVANLASGMQIEGGKPQSEANAPQAPLEGEWVIEAVDWKRAREPDLGSDRGLRVDAAGNPHVAYGRTSLNYAWHDGVDWQYETADSTAEVGRSASLALDAGGNPHIAYLDADNSDIKYAYRDGSGWHTEIVDPRGGDQISLAVDEEGYGHISFVFQDDLIYTYMDDTGWHARTVDSQTGSAGYYLRNNSLALDDDGFPHIGYHAEFTDPEATLLQDNLRYAYQDASGWYTQTVDSSARVGDHPSLALDSAGQPHISYHDIDHRSLKYAYLTATGWYSVTVDSSANDFFYASLDLDNQDQPHIAYSAAGAWEFNYASFDGSDWGIRAVPLSTYPLGAISIDVDDNEDVHLVYENWTNRALRYACYDGNDWHTAVVDGDPKETGKYTSLALDQDGYPHIGYYNAKHGSLKHIYKTSGGAWVNDNPNYSGADVGRYTSLAIDGYGYAHVTAYCVSLRDLVYAYQIMTPDLETCPMPISTKPIAIPPKCIPPVMSASTLPSPWRQAAIFTSATMTVPMVI
jgi:hypothetical protein